MNNLSSQTNEIDESAAEVFAASKQESFISTWVTCLACIICIGIFLGLATTTSSNSWDTLSQFGYLPADAIWKGGYWALITSAFVHLELWHVAFNVYWLWVLGSRLERSIGSLPFLGFVLISAFVSSSYQLATSDSTGIGASGVVYALFGLMWPTRHRFTLFREVLDSRTVQIFIIWLVGCIAATYLKVLEVGNAAHISGLLFGCAVAGAFFLQFNPKLFLLGLVSIIAFSIIPLFWCPWSVTWLSQKAYQAHALKQYDDAIERYNQIIRLDPRNAWAFQNRSYAYRALGQDEKASADWDMAREINPSIEKAK